MYDELVKRLRAQADAERYFVGEDMLYDKAADVIEELSATISKMEKATHWMPLPELPEEVLTGTDTRGGIRRDEAGNVIDWGIVGPPGDVGKAEEGE